MSADTAETRIGLEISLADGPRLDYRSVASVQRRYRFYLNAVLELELA